MGTYQGFKPTWRGGWRSGSTNLGPTMPPSQPPTRLPMDYGGSGRPSTSKTIDLGRNDYSRQSGNYGSATEEGRAYARKANHIRRKVQLATFARKMGWYALKGAFQMQPFTRAFTVADFIINQPWGITQPMELGEPAGYDFSEMPWPGWNQQSDWISCENTAVPWTGDGGTGGSTHSNTPGGSCGPAVVHVNAVLGKGPPEDLADHTLEWNPNGSWRYRASEWGPANGTEVWHRHAMRIKMSGSQFRANTGTWQIPYPRGYRIPLIRVGGRPAVATPIPFGNPFPNANPGFSTPFRPRNRPNLRPYERPSTDISIGKGGRGITRIAGRHKDVLPRARTRERKKKLSMGLVGALYGSFTEFMDWTEAVGKAIPKNPCKTRNPYDRVMCLMDNWDRINWAEAGKNIVEMQLEDFIIGKFASAANAGIANAADHGYYNSPVGTEFGKGYWRGDLNPGPVKEMKPK